MSLVFNRQAAMLPWLLVRTSNSANTIQNGSLEFRAGNDTLAIDHSNERLTVSNKGYLSSPLENSSRSSSQKKGRQLIPAKAAEVIH